MTLARIPKPLRSILLAMPVLVLAAATVRCSAQVSPRPSAAKALSQTPTAVTWSRDIAPIVYRNCTTCHHTGGAGPFSLLNYQDARRWATQVTDVTQSRYMPPWLPEHDPKSPAYVHFSDERSLTDADIALISKWAHGGMAEGNPAEAPAVPQYSKTWQHGEPDLVLTVERPFTLASSGSDTFRNFVLPYPLTQTHYIRAMEIRPGAPQVVHHANVLVDRSASYRRDHPHEWQDGVPGMELALDAGSGFDPDSHFLFWKPDTPYLVEPDTMPWRLDPGNDLVLNMHLKPSGKEEVITAQIGLYFTDKPPTQKPMLLQLEHDSALDIPAGDADFVVEDSLTLPVDVDLLGIYPHTHYLGRRLEAWAALPNQPKKPLILIPGWDIDRQSVYRYSRPILLRKGTVVHMRYVFDNSAANVHNPHNPPIRVHGGNRSEDEMAHLWLQVLPVNTLAGSPDPRLLLEEAWMRQRLRKEPTDPIALYNLASAEASLGKFPEAIATYERDIALHPGDERATTGLGAAFESANDLPRAAATYEQVIAAHPATCDARFNLAQLEMKQDQAHAAEQHLREMVKLCPPDAGVESALGSALQSQNLPEQAVAEFRSALVLNPNDFTALYNFGILAIQSGDSAKAVDLLAAASVQRPSDVDVLEQLAGAYMQGELPDNATEELNKAIRIAPQDAHLHSLLSQVLAGNGHLGMAIEEQKKANRLSPNDPDGWNNLGVMQARDGNRTEARADFLHALQLAPSHAQATANLQHLAK